MASVIALGLAGEANASGTTFTQAVPLSLTAFVSCGNAGVGESVQLSGSLQIVSSLTLDSAGGFHLYSHVNPQGVSGIGLSSGATYRGTGVTLTHLNLYPGIEAVSVNDFLLVGTAGAPSLRVHEDIAFVVDARGSLTATIDNLRLTCA
jgi:hypothetical protein